MAHTQAPIKVIKPVYIPWVYLARYLPLQLNLTFVGGAVGGALGFLMILLFELPWQAWTPLLVCAAFFFIGTPALVYFVSRSTYDKTDYKFYQDSLEYTEGFWTIEHKIIQYKNITEVSMRKNVIQRMYGLGTVYLAVPTIGAGVQKFSGVMIKDVNEPEKVYEQIQSIVSSCH